MSSTKLDSPLGLSASSRTLSANTLKDKLSKLATPLNVVNPVAALRANVKCVFVHIMHRITIEFWPSALQLPCSFVPAQIPRKRRLQMLAVALWSVMICMTTSVWLLLWYVPLSSRPPLAPFFTLLPLMPRSPPPFPTFANAAFPLRIPERTRRIRRFQLHSTTVAAPSSLSHLVSLDRRFPRKGRAK